MTADELSERLSVPVRRESTAEQVAGALRGLIVEGGLTPGTRLSEAELAERLSVSRNTAREGLRILISEGLVRRKIHRGAYVAEIEADDLRDIFRVRRLIEVTAVRELIETGADLAPLEAELDAVAAAAGATNGAVLAADLRFHQTLVEQIHSERLETLYGAASAEMAVCVALSSGAEVHAAQLVRELRGLMAALRKGNVDRAVELLTKHLAAGERRLLARFEAPTETITAARPA